jgi:hypothetical protein
MIGIRLRQAPRRATFLTMLRVTPVAAKAICAGRRADIWTKEIELEFKA